MQRTAALAAALLLAAPHVPAFAAEDGAQLRATYLYRFQ